MVARLNNAIELDGPRSARYIRDLSQKEINFVRNERAICYADAQYFKTRYCFICDDQNNIFKYSPRRSQLAFHQVITELDEQNVAIELQVLKARQQGISTEVQLDFTHRVIFVPATQAISASANVQKSELMTRMFQTVIHRLPWWLIGQIKRNRLAGGGGLLEFHSASIVAVQSGSQRTGIAQGWTPTCLPPSTKIRIANGFLKSLETVESSDQVLTHDGKMCQVRKVWCTDRSPEPTRIIKAWGNYSPLECSLDHRIRTDQGWVEASDISVGDYVSHPVRKVVQTLRSVPMEKLSRGSVRDYRIEKFDMELTPALGYLCGFYLAEGSIHESAINHPRKKPYISEITFTINEKEIADRIVKLRAFFGDSQHIRINRPKGTRSAHLVVSCAWLARWLAAHFGRKTKKTIPDWAWSSGRDFCIQVLHGYLEGDGHCDKQSNNVVAPCVCQALTYQLRDMVASLGFGWSSIYFLPARKALGINKKEIHQKDTWRIVLSGPTGAAYRERFGFSRRKPKSYGRHWRYAKDGHMEVMIESVSEGFSETFWDIEIDDPSHSFTTEQCAVHNCVHISECVDYDNPKKTIEEGLMKATHPSPKLFSVYESTGNGSVGWWADKWRASKEFYWQGRERWLPLFIPWHMADDLFPTVNFLKKFPIPEDWKPALETIKHAAKCRVYVRSTPLLAKILGPKWELPRHQMWFWEFNYQAHVRTNNKNVWLQQMAGDDRDALLGQHDSVFDAEVIEVVTKDRQSKYQVYGIVGEGIDKKFEPDTSEVDYGDDKVYPPRQSPPRIEIEWDSPRGARWEWMLIPLNDIDERNERSAMTKLLVFEPPIIGCDYSIGADTAEGHGEQGDRTVICVTRRGAVGQPDVQAAELCSDVISTADSAAFIACLSAWYGKGVPGWGMPLIGIEQRRKPGDDAQNQLIKMGFHRHFRFHRLDGKKTQEEERRSNRLGWYTMEWSRAYLHGRFIDAIENRWFEANSIFLIRECQSLEHSRTGKKSTIDHKENEHDDRVFAAGISIVISHTREVHLERAQKRYAAPRDTLPKIDMSMPTELTFSVGNF